MVSGGWGIDKSGMWYCWEPRSDAWPCPWGLNNHCTRNPKEYQNTVLIYFSYNAVASTQRVPCAISRFSKARAPFVRRTVLFVLYLCRENISHFSTMLPLKHVFSYLFVTHSLSMPLSLLADEDDSSTSMFMMNSPSVSFGSSIILFISLFFFFLFLVICCCTCMFSRPGDPNEPMEEVAGEIVPQSPNRRPRIQIGGEILSPSRRLSSHSQYANSPVGTAV